MLNVSEKFQSSFELMGYITFSGGIIVRADFVSKLFRAYGLYNGKYSKGECVELCVSKLFRAYGLYNVYSCKLIQ